MLCTRQYNCHCAFTLLPASQCEAIQPLGVADVTEYRLDDA